MENEMEKEIQTKKKPLGVILREWMQEEALLAQANGKHPRIFDYPEVYQKCCDLLGTKPKLQQLSSVLHHWKTRGILFTPPDCKAKLLRLQHWEATKMLMADADDWRMTRAAKAAEYKELLSAELKKLRDSSAFAGRIIESLASAPEKNSPFPYQIQNRKVGMSSCWLTRTM